MENKNIQENFWEKNIQYSLANIPYNQNYLANEEKPSSGLDGAVLD